MLDKAARRIRYAVGNVVRFLSVPWRQWIITPADATTIFGCGFGDDGWHHLRQTLREFDADTSISAERTALWRFLKNFQPQHTLSLIGEDEGQLPLFVYPWGTFDRASRAGLKDPWISRFCGPSCDDFIHEEYRRTVKLYELMRRDGYRPWQFPNSFIGGTLLIKEDDQRRFVVMQGNHRMAVLAHLGVQRIAVRAMPGHLPVVRERDVDRWPAVTSGLCTAEQARKLFRHFFDQSGQRIIQMLDGPMAV